ncbi:MAG: D-TA family PLP-dependent enzyme [Planctomycetaceae bacterium]|nr:D-TA family PLP-dependent enzyme [Planctomycetaceae bacterium]
MSACPPATDRWFAIESAARIPSPALVLYRDRIGENIRRMIAIAGSAERLRPHAKTHKLGPVARLQIDAGIRKFKCATLPEAQMLAEAGAADVLVAFGLAGPARETFARLLARYPATQFSVLIDNLPALERLEWALQQESVTGGVYLDLDVGMHRTGVAPGPEAIALYERAAASPVMRPLGLHAYDGHLKQHDPAERAAASAAGFAPVEALAAELRARGHRDVDVIAGGSPTFAIHAAHPERTLSPGTCVFWDWAYTTKFPDLDFLHAALVLTRVISRPTNETLCLDLGYKGVSPDNADPRAAFPQIPDAQMVVHSEEHLLIRTRLANQFAIDDCLYAIPYHVCPTVALYDEALVVAGGSVIATWPILARRRSVALD